MLGEEASISASAARTAPVPVATTRQNPVLGSATGHAATGEKATARGASAEKATVMEGKLSPSATEQKGVGNSGLAEKGIGGPPPPVPKGGVIPPILESPNVKLIGETAGTGGIKRIWAVREPNGTVRYVIDGELKNPIKRNLAPNFNQELPSASSVGLPDYEIAHLWGPGFGDEAWDGMMYAPRDVNQFLQNRGIEDRLRELHALANRERATIQLMARAESHPPRTPPIGHQLLKEVHYDFSVRLHDGHVLSGGRIDIIVPPPGGGRPQIHGYPGSAGPWSLF